MGSPVELSVLSNHSSRPTTRPFCRWGPIPEQEMPEMSHSESLTIMYIVVYSYYMLLYNYQKEETSSFFLSPAHHDFLMAWTVSKSKSEGMRFSAKAVGFNAALVLSHFITQSPGTLIGTPMRRQFHRWVHLLLLFWAGPTGHSPSLGTRSLQGVGEALSWFTTLGSSEFKHLQAWKSLEIDQNDSF